jgi:signal transduction histidine kinase
VGCIFSDVTERAAAERALAESEQYRRDILSRLLLAEEGERSRIATELHDDTVQVMTAALISMDMAANTARESGDTRIESAIAAARATLEEATERTRRLMFELRPAVLHELGLQSALRVLVDETAREATASVDFRCEATRYDHAVEELIYRGAREVLANVRKHADPDTISFLVEERDGEVVCEVRDDGHGFDPTEARSRPGAFLHLGLDSLSERVQAAGGAVSIRSAPGEGTEVRFSIPVHART